MLPGYLQTLVNKAAENRYREKLDYISGVDPYEIHKTEFKDNLDLWPDVYIHVGMYLLFKESSYTQESLMNYKS